MSDQFGNRKQNIPEVFEKIIENDRIVHTILNRVIVGIEDDYPLYVSPEEWQELQRRWALKKDLMRVAEEKLRWNTNKGIVA